MAIYYNWDQGQRRRKGLKLKDKKEEYNARFVVTREGEE